jgi:CBS domain-containing protein
VETIKHILATKGSEVWSVSPDASVYDAIRQMAERGVGALLVMEGERLAGIVSERDYARKVILEGRASRETPVADIMTADLVLASPDQGVEHCLATMTAHRVRHLPVVQAERVVGMVSIGDLVKAVIADQQHTIEELERYIAG